jgi:hypothetical protein
MEMDSARRKSTGDIVDAESLWDTHPVDKDDYECHDCAVKAWPASYLRGVNLRRPYFKLSPNASHGPSCGVLGAQTYLERAKAAPLGTGEGGFPLPWPDRLVLAHERPAVDVAGTGRGPDAASGNRTRAGGDGPPRGGGGGRRGHAVGTLRPICRAYIAFPHDRAGLPLAVPQCVGQTFDQVFRRLSGSEITVHREPRRLYYAALQWCAPTVNEAAAEWLLDAGEWDAAHKRRGIAYRVRVVWSHWTPRQRETLRREVEIARDEAKQHKEKAVKAWMFFVGTQDADDPALLVVDRFELVCCLMAQMIYPPRA